MRIVVAHNFYQRAGGEDHVFTAEVRLLRDAGHDVACFTMHNDAIERMSRLGAAAATVWNRAACDQLAAMVRDARAQVAHFHNTFPLISPAAYSAVHAQGAAVVQTIHNFRFLAPCAVLLRDGRVCEDCIDRHFAWPAAVHGCYRGSRAGSAVVAAATLIHRSIGTWQREVDAYIAPSEFVRRKFLGRGLPKDRIIVKPHFLDPAPAAGDGAGGYAAYVGRLSPEKGPDLLLEAWKRLSNGLRLKIAGDGPLAPDVRQSAAADGRIECLGQRTADEVYELLGNAAFLVLPSLCYESFGRAAIEAFARGTPVIAAAHGALADIVEHGRTGLLFRPGDAGDLAAQIMALSSDAGRLAMMRREARREFEARYTGAANLPQLEAVYERAMDHRARRGS